MARAIAHLNPSLFYDVIAKGVARRNKDVIFDLKATLIYSFGLPKTGRPGKHRQASAVGEAPAIQSGNLLRNMKESFPDALTGVLLIDTEYAAILEEKLGRPYYTPAIENLADRFETNSSGRFA